MKLSTLIKLSPFILALSFYPTVYAEKAQIDTSTSEATTPHPDLTNVKPTAQEDTIITNSIKSQIEKSKTLSKLNVEVQTHEGIVSLEGTTDSDSQASSLVELAQSIVGVKDVDAGNLKVKESKQPFTDMMITAKIKGLFIREKIFGDKDIAAMNISVETNNGIVYLTGAIDNQNQVKNAVKLIQGVKGVKKVEYNVKKVTPNSNNNAVTTSSSDNKKTAY